LAPLWVLFFGMAAVLLNIFFGAYVSTRGRRSDRRRPV
jgi:hypothetical protein